MADPDLAQSIERLLARQAEVTIEREDVDRLVRGLGRILGLADLALDDTNTVTIVLDDEIEVALTHLPGRPYLVASAAMPDRPGHRGQLYRRLLASNLDLAHTHGGTFAVIPATGVLVLCGQVDISDGAIATLDEGLARFVDLAGAWQAEIADYLEQFGLAQEEDDILAHSAMARPSRFV